MKQGELVKRGFFNNKVVNEQFLEAQREKFKKPQSEFDTEKMLKSIQPRDTVKRKQIKEYLKTKVDEFNEQGKKSLAAAYNKWIAQFDVESLETHINSEFTVDFQKWLIGVGNDKDHQRTPWGRQRVNDKECNAYLSVFLDARFEFTNKLQEMIYKAKQLGGLDGIEEYYMFFKYIVRGGWDDQTLFADWLSEWRSWAKLKPDRASKKDPGLPISPYERDTKTDTQDFKKIESAIADSVAGKNASLVDAKSSTQEQIDKERTIVPSTTDAVLITSAVAGGGQALPPQALPAQMVAQSAPQNLPPPPPPPAPVINVAAPIVNIPPPTSSPIVDVSPNISVSVDNKDLRETLININTTNAQILDVLKNGFVFSDASIEKLTNSIKSSIKVSSPVLQPIHPPQQIPSSDIVKQLLAELQKNKATASPPDVPVNAVSEDDKKKLKTHGDTIVSGVMSILLKTIEDKIPEYLEKSFVKLPDNVKIKTLLPDNFKKDLYLDLDDKFKIHTRYTGSQTDLNVDVAPKLMGRYKGNQDKITVGINKPVVGVYTGDQGSVSVDINRPLNVQFTGGPGDTQPPPGPGPSSPAVSVGSDGMDTSSYNPVEPSVSRVETFSHSATEVHHVVDPQERAAMVNLMEQNSKLLVQYHKEREEVLKIRAELENSKLLANGNFVQMQKEFQQQHSQILNEVEEMRKNKTVLDTAELKSQQQLLSATVTRLDETIGKLAEKIDKAPIAKDDALKGSLTKLLEQQQVMSRITLMSTLDESTRSSMFKKLDHNELTAAFGDGAFNLGGFLRDSNERLRGDAFIELVAKSHINTLAQIEKMNNLVESQTKTDQNINETLKNLSVANAELLKGSMLMSTNLESVANALSKIKQDLSSNFNSAEIAQAVNLANTNISDQMERMIEGQKQNFESMKTLSTTLETMARDNTTDEAAMKEQITKAFELFERQSSVYQKNMLEPLLSEAAFSNKLQKSQIDILHSLTEEAKQIKFHVAEQKKLFSENQTETRGLLQNMANSLNNYHNVFASKLKSVISTPVAMYNNVYQMFTGSLTGPVPTPKQSPLAIEAKKPSSYLSDMHEKAEQEFEQRFKGQKRKFDAVGSIVEEKSSTSSTPPPSSSSRPQTHVTEELVDSIVPELDNDVLQKTKRFKKSLQDQVNTSFEFAEMQLDRAEKKLVTDFKLSPEVAKGVVKATKNLSNTRKLAMNTAITSASPKQAYNFGVQSSNIQAEQVLEDTIRFLAEQTSKRTGIAPADVASVLMEDDEQ